MKVLVPEESAAFTGRLALPSLEVIPTVSVTVLIKFQFASTAFTVTVNTVPPCSLLAVPVFPLVAPGAAVSPGTKSCSFANVPAVTGITLEFGVLAGVVISLAVSV